MSTLAVARKDFSDSARSRRLWVLIAVFVIFVAGLAYYFAEIANAGQNPNAGSLALIGSLLVPTAILLPAIGILTGYRSVIGERESGSLKLLLSLPHRRRDVVLGKLVGRSAVVALAVVIGFAVGGAVLFGLASNIPLGDYALLVLLTILLGVTFVSIGVGLSAGLRSENLVVILGFGLVVLFTLLWQVLLFALSLVLGNFEVGSQALRMDVITFLAVLSPRQAFLLAYSGLSSANRNVTAQGGMTSNELWMQDWFGFVVLAIWLVVPLALGYLRFKDADL